MEHLGKILINQDNLQAQRALFGLVFEEFPTYQEIRSGTPKLSLVFKLFSDSEQVKSPLVTLGGVEPPPFELTVQTPHRREPTSLSSISSPFDWLIPSAQAAGPCPVTPNDYNNPEAMTRNWRNPLKLDFHTVVNIINGEKITHSQIILEAFEKLVIAKPEIFTLIAKETEPKASSE